MQREEELERERQRMEEERQKKEEEEARELAALQRRIDEEKLKKAIEVNTLHFIIIKPSVIIFSL